MNKHRILKGLTAAALTAALAFGSPALPETITGLSGLVINAEAATEIPEPPSKNYTGFVSDNGNKYYFDNGTPIVSTVKEIDGKKYLFGKNGNLLIGGIFTVKGNKYHTDKNGVVACNDWVVMKKYVYYHANSKGILTKYSFVQHKDNNNDIYYHLAINDEIASSKKLFKNFNESKIVIKICNDYFALSKISDNFFSFGKYSTFSNNTAAYDILTSKYIGSFYGKPNLNEYGLIKSGSLLNSKDGKLYKFNGKNKNITQKQASALVITNKKVSLNSVGGVDYYLDIINNSDKTIKYIYYTVYSLNRVGDKVACRIWNQYYFTLSDTGPYKPYESTDGTWEAFMYNNSAYDVKISSVTIEYMDGTKKTLNGNQITYL